MNMHSNLSGLFRAGLLTLLATSHAIAGNHNPCDYACTQKLISEASGSSAQPLTAADWEAACTTGTPAQAGGCFGNISSPAFAKINAALGGFSSMANLPIANVPRSLYLVQFFGDSQNTLNPSQVDVFLTISGSIAASCVLAVTEGSEVGYNGVQNCTKGITAGSSTINNMQNKVTTIQGPTGVAVTSHQQYQSCSNTGTGAARYSPVNVPMYLVCIGNTIESGANVVTGFSQISAS